MGGPGTVVRHELETTIRIESCMPQNEVSEALTHLPTGLQEFSGSQLLERLDQEHQTG